MELYVLFLETYESGEALGIYDTFKKAKSHLNSLYDYINYKEEFTEVDGDYWYNKSQFYSILKFELNRGETI